MERQMKFSPRWPCLFATEDGDVYYYGIRKVNSWSDRFGYKRLAIPKTKKNLYVHRVVADAFYPGAIGLEVNHINGIKGDNRASNLEWCSRKENMTHAVNTGLLNCLLSQLEVFEVRERHARGETVAELCATHMVSVRNMYNILNGDTYKDAGGSIKPSGGLGRHRGELSPSSKLKGGDVLDIRSRVLAGDKWSDIAASYGVNRQTIYDISKGNTWKWLK